MKKRLAKLICHIAVWAIIILLVFSLSSCQKNIQSEKIDKARIICTWDDSLAYTDVISEILPSYILNKAEQETSLFSCINKGYVVDAFDVQALAALEAGIAGQ